MKKILLCLCAASALYAQVGKVVSLRGDAVVVRGGKEFKVRSLDELKENDVIKTSKNARLQVRFKDDTIITLGKNTTLNVNQYLIDGKNSRVDLSVSDGSYKVISGQISKLARQNFKFQARTATIGIRGTVFVGELGDKSAKIADKVGCLEGAIDVKVGDKMSRINAGRQMSYLQNRVVKVEKLSSRDYEVTQALKLNAPAGENDQAAYGGYDAASKQAMIEAKKGGNYGGYDAAAKQAMIEAKKAQIEEKKGGNYGGKFGGNYGGYKGNKIDAAIDSAARGNRGFGRVDFASKQEMLSKKREMISKKREQLFNDKKNKIQQSNSNFGGGNVNRPNAGGNFGGGNVNRPNAGGNFGGGNVNRPNAGGNFGGGNVNRPNAGGNFGGGNVNRPNGGNFGGGANRPNGGNFGGPRGPQNNK